MNCGNHYGLIKLPSKAQWTPPRRWHHLQSDPPYWFT